MVFLWIILIDQNSEISNFLKKYRIWNSFFGDAHSNSRSCSRIFFAQHSQLWMTKVFMTDIDIRYFSLTLAEVFSVRIFLYDVNQSYFLPISAKFFFRWCWLGLFSHWRHSWEIFANVGQGFFLAIVIQVFSVDVDQWFFWSMLARFFLLTSVMTNFWVNTC